jgi:DNA-binding NarL/FixJ family response regulator
VIRVAIADDEQLIRIGLRALLGFAADLEVVAEAIAGDDAIAMLERYEVDVLLLDIRMPRRDGLAVLQWLNEEDRSRPTPVRSEQPATPRNSGKLEDEARLEKPHPTGPGVIVLTTFDDAELLLASVRAGARGFLPKDVSLEELLETIRAVAAGATRFQSAVTTSLRRAVERSDHPGHQPLVETLTAREREVLRLMAAGLSNREIAETLTTAEATVKNQVSSILSKLGVRDRTRAVLTGIEQGMV